MNYPRVNLLKKNEQRYQGTVSRGFMFVGIVVTPILFIAILSGVKLVQYGGVQLELKASREIWKNREPRMEFCLEQRRGLKTNQQAIKMIDGWKESKVSMDGLLSAIQTAIPENIQITRLSVRGSVAQEVYTTVEELDLNYRFALQGVSHGDQAEDAVIHLRRELLASQDVASVFDSVNLGSMRKRGGNEAENVREFILEGVRSEGDEQ